MVNKKGFTFSMSSTDDEDDSLSRSDGSGGSSGSLSQPLLSSDNSNVNKTPNNHVLSDCLFVERNKKLAKACVMLTVIFERAAYYGLLGNLAFFANVHLDYKTGESVYATLAFSGFTWISCFLGGILGDAFLGRYETIITGLIFYITGYINLTWLAYFTTKHTGRSAKCVAWFVCTLVLISLGEGCFKSNMSPFGADQIVSNTVDHTEMRSFFNYFYWAINIGSLIGFSLIVWIQVEFDFVIGYLVPCLLISLAAVVFISPRMRNYHVISPKKSVIMIFKIIYNSMRRNRFVYFKDIRCVHIYFVLFIHFVVTHD